MATTGTEFALIYGRELDRLASEIAAYESEADLWTTVGGQKNSPGTLALHTVGSMLSKIGAELGGTGYVRDRPREFAERDVPRERLLALVRECRDTITRFLEAIDDEAMEREYPGQAPAGLEGISVRGYLMHMLWHLGWHLGHIYYHRLGIASPS
jgi:hypothetical protein